MHLQSWSPIDRFKPNCRMQWVFMDFKMSNFGKINQTKTSC